MAELTGPVPPDLVSCRCGQQSDRNIYSQCPRCSANLWEVVGVAAPRPDPVVGPSGASHTALERAPSARAGIDVLVGGRRFAMAPGTIVRLGRDEAYETAECLAQTMNISRRHAVLRFDGTQLWVTDTDSSNGTFVNDHQLPPKLEYELRPGQMLRLASDVAVEIEWPT